MEICYSKNNRPYIVMDGGLTYLIFAEETSTPTHYRYLLLVTNTTSTMTYTTSGSKKEKKVEVNEDIRTFIPFNFKGIPRNLKKVVESDDFETFRDAIEEFVTPEGYFPKSALPLLEERLKEINEM